PAAVSLVVPAVAIPVPGIAGDVVRPAALAVAFASLDAFAVPAVVRVPVPELPPAVRLDASALRDLIRPPDDGRRHQRGAKDGGEQRLSIPPDHDSFSWALAYREAANDEPVSCRKSG